MKGNTLSFIGFCLHILIDIHYPCPNWTNFNCQTLSLGASVHLFAPHEITFLSPHLSKSHLPLNIHLRSYLCHEAQQISPSLNINSTPYFTIFERSHNVQSTLKKWGVVLNLLGVEYLNIIWNCSTWQISGLSQRSRTSRRQIDR